MTPDAGSRPFVGGEPVDARRRAVRGGRWLAVAGFAAVAWYALFRLPFHWPPEQRLVSPSYAFGFNNRVAILAAVGLLGALALLLALRDRRTGATRLPLRFESADTSRGSGWPALAAVVLLYAALTAAMYVYTVRSEPFLVWETRHFMHRLLLMDVYGLRPYIDFQAEYGPALTVTPLYAYRLLRPFGATHMQAYFLCHLLLNVAGLACLHYVLWRAAMPARARVFALVLLAVAGFGPWMGLNGVLLRYLCPFASVLLGHRVVARLLDGGGSPGRWAAAGAIVLVLLGTNIVISPEIALAFALAWVAYATLLVRRDWRVLAVSVVALVMAGLLVRATLPPAYYGSLLRFSEGANNLPLLPGPHLLLYLLTLFLVVPSLLAAGLRALAVADAPDAASAALCGALGGLCVVLAPGALGRADPPHLLFYGLGVSMLLMIRLANASRRWFALYAAAYAAVHVVLTPVVLLVQFYDVSPRVLLSREGPAHIVDRVRSAAGTSPTDAAHLSALGRYPRLGIPFATYNDPAVERHVMGRGQLAPEYYVATVGVYTDAALARKLRDMAGHDHLLVREGYEVPWSRDQCAEYLRQLRRSTLFPTRLRCRAQPLDADGAVNRFIAERYVPVERVGGWLVVRRAAAPGPPGAASVQGDGGRSTK